MGEAILKIVLLLLAAGCALLLIGSWVLYRHTFRRTPEATVLSENEFNRSHARVRAAQALQNACTETVTISATDGTRLVGRYYEHTPGAPLVLFFHGYRSHAALDGQEFYEIAKKQGWNLLLVTHRAHGESGSDLSTVGVREQYDCLQWANWANERFGSGASVFLMGVSFSGTIVLMASCLPLPPCVRGIIDDSGFTSYPEMCKANLPRALPKWFPIPLFLFFLTLGARLYGHFDLYQVDARRAVQKARVPILILHGALDSRAPISMGYALFAACAEPKRLVIVPGASHVRCFQTDPAAYRQAIAGFIRDYTP